MKRIDNDVIYFGIVALFERCWIVMHFFSFQMMVTQHAAKYYY